MTLEKQLEIFDTMTAKRRSILQKKGHDYANEDRLSNFKTAGAIINLSPEMVCLSLIATKVARLGTLISEQKEPNNESIQDSILDLSNYSDLLNCILIEKSGKNNLFSSSKSIMQKGKDILARVLMLCFLHLKR